VNRDDGATFLGERFGAYLDVVLRTATDTAGNLMPVIDDALRALGTVAADLATAAPAGEDAEEDFRVQLAYRAMLQVVRDMGNLFNLSTAGDTFQLRQMRENAEKDLAIAKEAVLERFGTLGVVASDSDVFVATIDLNFLEDAAFDAVTA
jgi:hypothetical protein